MKHAFQVTALDAGLLDHFFQASDTELIAQGARRMIVDKKPGYPCRISLEDAEIGEEVILLTYDHHQVNSPYQAKGPVYIRPNATTAQLPVNQLPLMLNHRLLSLRAYDNAAMMRNAATVKGSDLRETIQAFFDNPDVQYIQVHNAGPGCYNCQINRA